MRLRVARRLFTALLFLAAAAVNADTLHIIETRHRPASEIEQVLRPLLRPDEALSASGYRLILRASDARREEMERLVAALDVAPRQLTITVRQGIGFDDKRQRDAVSGEVGVGSRGRVIAGEEREGSARARLAALPHRAPQLRLRGDPDADAAGAGRQAGVSAHRAIRARDRAHHRVDRSWTGARHARHRTA